eukprot:5627488-Lingulodinium_polyedra.AAC.1
MTLEDFKALMAWSDSHQSRLDAQAARQGEEEFMQLMQEPVSPTRRESTGAEEVSAAGQARSP